MFLHVKSNGSAIKGEARDDQHQDEIEVFGWSWGMESKSAAGANAPISKRTLRELNILKKVDAASVPLMMAMSTNARIEAVLTLRKAGKSRHEYLKITLKQGRITSFDVRTGDQVGDATVVERLSFSFQKIMVDYVPQGDDGMPKGGMSFEDQTSA